MEPPEQVHQAIYRVIPGKRMLDPGSSLLETTRQTRNNHPQTTYCVILADSYP